MSDCVANDNSYEVQVRQAYFFSAASVAGAFSGLLAYGISFMEGVGGLAGWRWYRPSIPLTRQAH